MSFEGSARSLGEGSQSAFRALINSIAPETVAEGDDKLASETVEKLSQKLHELVGDESIKGYKHHRNERGELVNEDGLPVIEISELVAQSDKDDHEQPSTIHDVPLIRLSSLPSVAREKLRQQRNRILDKLEEEERQGNERQRHAEREEREVILRKRREEAVNEKARLQRAKELQKKMGKVLVRSMGDGEKEADSSKEGDSEKCEDFQPTTDTNVRKKTVTFVETDDANKPEWGDVTAATLRSGKRPTLLQSFRPDLNPVKLNVIERNPAAHISTTQNQPTLSVQSTKDSDDESEPEDQQNAASDIGEGDDEVVEELPDSEEEEGEVEFENECDLDYAQHQREIALEYFNKRNTIGQDAAKAMMNHSHGEESENGSALEAPVLQSQPKSSISRFKAGRIASAYQFSNQTKPSTSIGEASIPESTARTIQRAVRSGSLDDNNRLVGGDRDSDSELETEGLQEALELLKKGEVYNLGPDGQYLHVSQKTPPILTVGTSATGMTDTIAGISAAAPTSTVAQQQGLQQRLLPTLNRPKTSKFKADRSRSGRPSTVSCSETPNLPTSLVNNSRSSSKPPLPLADMITEKEQRGQVQTANAPEGTPPFHLSFIPSSTGIVPTIIDSPSFTAPKAARSSPSTSVQSFTSMIVESPSFPPPGQRSRRPERPPEIVSSQLVTGAPTRAIAVESRGASLPSSRGARVESSSTVTTMVLERTPPASKDISQNSLDPSQGKISRFRKSRDVQS